MSSKYIGMNPKGLSDEMLATMPPGARLLESDAERARFLKYQKPHADLWCYWKGKWESRCWGFGVSDTTYCTTRPRGWWKRKAENKKIWVLVRESH